MAVIGAYLPLLGIIVVGEVLFHLLFMLVGWLFNVQDAARIRPREVFKGFIERIMIALGLVYAFITVLIAFAALKVATKLSISSADHDQAHVLRHNDYFLIGNILSIIFGISYAIIAKQFFHFGAT